MNRNRLIRIDRATPPRGYDTPPPPPAVRTAADVVALIEHQVGAVVRDPRVSTAERARAISSLARAALAAIQLAAIEDRVAALEATLGRRDAP